MTQAAILSWLISAFLGLPLLLWSWKLYVAWCVGALVMSILSPLQQH